MEVLADVDAGVLLVVVDVDLEERVFGHLFQCVLGPHLEPVDVAAVDERGKLAYAVAERLADGREGDHHVQVVLAAVDEEGEESERRELGVLVLSGGLRRTGDRLHDLAAFVGREQVRHFARVQQAVDVF